MSYRKILSSNRLLVKSMGGISVPTDLEGRLRNLPDFSSEALFPVFEAVVNSIHAIQERGLSEKGEIRIRIIREMGDQDHISNDSNKNERELAKIKSFEIEDNGIGFNKNNFDSFYKMDSTYKINRGGKGIGRLYWLKAFDKIEVESVYADDGKQKLRRFNFTKNKWVREEFDDYTEDTKPQKTTIKLIDFKEQYRKRQSAYKRTKTIAERIFDYCISYYIMNAAPSIIVIDNGERINLDNLYKENAKKMSDIDIKIDGKVFKISHTKLNSKYNNEHKLVFCADNREVSDYSLRQQLGSSEFIDLDEQSYNFYYVGYVSSKYLDERVDNSRASFYISEDDKENLSNFTGNITMSKIRENIIENTMEFLSKYIKKLDDIKHEKVNDYISKNPALRNVPVYCPEVYKEINADAPPEKIHAALYKHKGVAELEVQKKAEDILKSQAESIEEIKEKYEEVTKEINAFNTDDLAKYLIWRKLIIQLLDQKIRLNKKNDNHEKESIIHDIVFPRDTTSDQISFDNLNLWIIDEQLTFHKFAASDKKLNKISSSDSGTRPDIFICTEGDENKPASAISIIEFKRPMRGTYDKDPIEQIYEYIREIKNKTINTYDGRPILVSNSTRFYGYAICDITNQIDNFAESKGFLKLINNEGYYGFNQNYNSYTEVLSFDEMLSDVKRRHKRFFEKLGIHQDI